MTWYGEYIVESGTIEITEGELIGIGCWYDGTGKYIIGVGCGL